MKIEEWKNLYEILKGQYSEFLIHYPQMENGRNQKIRKTAETKVNNCINLCCIWISKYGEAYCLLTGENSDDFARAINWNEFEHPNYFKNDMKEFLEKMKSKIESMETE